MTDDMGVCMYECALLAFPACAFSYIFINPGITSEYNMGMCVPVPKLDLMTSRESRGLNHLS